jgi:hypothetical protein
MTLTRYTRYNPFSYWTGILALSESDMHLLLAFFTSISVVLAGTLQIMDHEGQCFVYSTEIFDCTGISKPFAPLNGTSCSSKTAIVDEKLVLTDPRFDYSAERHQIRVRYSQSQSMYLFRTFRVGRGVSKRSTLLS